MSKRKDAEIKNDSPKKQLLRRKLKQIKFRESEDSERTVALQLKRLSKGACQKIQKKVLLPELVKEDEELSEEKIE